MPQTLAQLVRAKYPGAYDDLSDADLEAKVDRKYPGAYADLPRSRPGPSAPTNPGYLTGAEGISATPWHSQGMFGGRGPSVRDALGALPAVGGAIGGIAGAPGLGTAIGGAALGGAGGEALKQLGERAIGVQAPASGTEAAQKIATEAAIQGGAELGGRALAGGARALGKGMVENAVRPPIALQREFPEVIDTIVKERLPVGAGLFGKEKGSQRAARRLAEESGAVKALLERATAGGKTFESSKLAEPVLKLIDEVAEQEALAPGGVKQLGKMIENFLAKKKGPLSPLDVQNLKQEAQALAKPVYKAVAMGNPVRADQAVGARFQSAVAKGSKEALETIPGVAEGEAKKRALIGAKKALSQAEMRRLSLMGEAGAAVMGTAAGQVVAPMDDPLKKSAVGWLIARGALSPRTLSRSGLILTSQEAASILRQFPRLGAYVLSGATNQEPQTGPPE